MTLKREQLNLKFRPLTSWTSILVVNTQLLLYKSILQPIWTYGIQLSGCNIKVIQMLQNKVIRSIVYAPWYIRNEDIGRDLKGEDDIKRSAGKHKKDQEPMKTSKCSLYSNLEDCIRANNRFRPNQGSSAVRIKFDCTRSSFLDTLIILYQDIYQYLIN